MAAHRPDLRDTHPAVPDRWPELPQVLRYRDRVRADVLASVDLVAERAAVDRMARDGRVFFMVVEHELMHQETLLYMVQQLAPELKAPPTWLPAYSLGPSRAPGEGSVPAGRAMLGAGSGDLVRPSFRDWFQAHYPYVFTKFRCVAGD